MNFATANTWEQRLEAVRHAIRSWCHVDPAGCAVQDVTETERRLGWRLPAALREFYMTMGSTPAVWRGCNPAEDLPYEELFPIDALPPIMEGRVELGYDKSGCVYFADTWPPEQDPFVSDYYLEPESASGFDRFSELVVDFWLKRFSDLQSRVLRPWPRLELTGQRLLACRNCLTRIPYQYSRSDPSYEGTQILLIDHVLYGRTAADIDRVAGAT